MRLDLAKTIAITAALFLMLTAFVSAQTDSAWLQLRYETNDFQYENDSTLTVELWVKSNTNVKAASLGFEQSRFLFDYDSAKWNPATTTVDGPQIDFRADTAIIGGVSGFINPVMFEASADYFHAVTVWMTFKADSTGIITTEKQQFFLDSTFFPPAGPFIFTAEAGTNISPEFEGDTIQLGISKVYDIEKGTLPENFTLGNNYPNPFNPTTNIEFALPKKAHVRLDVYNMLGQKVRTLVDKELEAGFKVVTWDGKDDSGSEVASGVYLYKMDAGSFSQSKKMSLVK